MDLRERARLDSSYRMHLKHASNTEFCIEIREHAVYWVACTMASLRDQPAPSFPRTAN